MRVRQGAGLRVGVVGCLRPRRLLEQRVAGSRGSAPTPVVSPAPAAPAGLSLAALQRLHWTALPDDPLGPRQLAATAWTGQEFLAVGGEPVVGDGPAFRGADAYDPQTGRWQLLPTFPLAARDTPASAWTGYGLVIWGGESTPGHSRGFRPRAARWCDLRRQLSGGGTLMPAGPLPALSSAGRGHRCRGSGDHHGRHAAAPGDRQRRTARGRAGWSRAMTRRPGRGARFHAFPAVHDHDLVQVDAVRWGTRIARRRDLGAHRATSAPGAHRGKRRRRPLPGSTRTMAAGRRSALRHRSRSWAPTCVRWVIAAGDRGRHDVPARAACLGPLNSAFTLLRCARAWHGRDVSGPPIEPVPKPPWATATS